MKNANEIFEIMKAAYETSGYEYYGLRYCSENFSDGEELENSHQWYQDDPANWGEECEYNADLGMWDGGELNGVCSIGLPYYWESSEAISDEAISDIEKAIKRIESYHYGDRNNLYIIGGNYAEGGNDPGEVIIGGAIGGAVVVFKL